MAETTLENVQARLQGHTEVLSRILGFAHPSAILSCLRTTRRYHALAYRHIDLLYRHVFIDRYTVNSVFRGIIWSRVGAVQRVSSWESFTQYRVPDRVDSDAVDEKVRRAKRKLHRTRQQEKRQAMAKRWRPDLAEYCSEENEEEDEEDEDYYSDEEDMYTPVESDVTMSYFSEGSSDFQEGNSGTGSMWSGDSQSLSEMEDVSGHRGQSSIPEDGSKALEWSDIVRGGHNSGEEEDQSEREDQIIRQARSQESSDDSGSVGGWSTPPDEACVLEEGILSSTSSVGASATSSSQDSGADASDDGPLRSRWDYVAQFKNDVPASRTTWPRSLSQTSTASFEYEYSSDADAQHTRKLHALSQCRVLTLSDRFIDRYGYGSPPSYTGNEYGYRSGFEFRDRDRYSDRHENDNYIEHSYPNPRVHSHRILHNGKAHLLPAGIETLRILTPWFSHPAETTGVENICRQGRFCPFVQKLSPRKVVHRNVGKCCGTVAWGKALDELVLFFPYAGWLPDHVTGRQDQGLSGIAAVSAKACKIVFGPYVEPEFPSRKELSLDQDSEGDWEETWDGGWDKKRSKREPQRATFKNWTLTNVVQIIHAASKYREELTIYGLERVKVLRGFQLPFFDTTDIPPHRLKWHNRRHRKRAYGPQELAEMVQYYLDELLSQSSPPRVVRFQYRTIEEYLATNPVDELFSTELEHNTRIDSSWLVSKYWKSKSLWRQSAVIPELAEGIPHESDTDEDCPVYKRPKHPNVGSKEEKALQKRQAYENRLTSRNLGL